MRPLQPADLKCEHLDLPRGLNTRQPRFTWALTGEGRNRRQTACRIVVGTERDAVAAGRGDLWDSGKVASSETILIPYAGRPLAPHALVHWSVQAWDEQDQVSALATPARFYTGFL